MENRPRDTLPAVPATSRTLPVGDINMHVTEAGSGPAVLLVHGFPELAHSWRHQVAGLEAAGYRAIAPDMRGFGGTSAPDDIAAYDIEHLAGDLIGLLDALALPSAALVGHDWGADVAWKTALLHPDRVRAVAGLSVPYVPRAPAPPTPIMREHLGEDFYIVWFQTPGPADTALAQDVRRTLATRETWTREWSERHDVPPTPRWLTEEDLAVYVDAFNRTGFTGGLNWYRNIDRNWELLAAVEGRTIDQPALFITGSRDPVRVFMPHEVMAGVVTDLRDVVLIDGAGHWVQQERPDEVNAALLAWLGDLPAE